MPESDKPFEFLSYGGGVNSTAILVLEKPQNVIFADTGDEHPDTYSYIESWAKPFVESYGGSFVTVRNPKYSRLQDQAMKEKIIPVRVNRWCTDKYKIRPIRRYLKENGLLPAVQIIGIDAGEGHRARESDHEQFHNRFPLIEQGLDREGCIEVIRRAGLPVPRKSGCFYCPFQAKGQWIALKRDHSELFQIAVDLEKNGSNFGRATVYCAKCNTSSKLPKGGEIPEVCPECQGLLAVDDDGFYLAGNRPLEDWIHTGRIRAPSDDQLELAMPCACYDG